MRTFIAITLALTIYGQDSTRNNPRRDLLFGSRPIAMQEYQGSAHLYYDDSTSHTSKEADFDTLLEKANFYIEKGDIIADKDQHMYFYLSLAKKYLHRYMRDTSALRLLTALIIYCTNSSFKCIRIVRTNSTRLCTK